MQYWLNWLKPTVLPAKQCLEQIDRAIGGYLYLWTLLHIMPALSSCVYFSVLCQIINRMVYAFVPAFTAKKAGTNALLFY